jgi:hypothetical protein
MNMMTVVMAYRTQPGQCVTHTVHRCIWYDTARNLAECRTGTWQRAGHCTQCRNELGTASNTEARHDLGHVFHLTCVAIGISLRPSRPLRLVCMNRCRMIYDVYCIYDNSLPPSNLLALLLINTC